MSSDFQRSCIRSYIDHDKIMSLRSHLAKNKDLDRQAEILAMLGDPTRLKILFCLAQADELCVCDLADILDMEISAISHQLRRLKDRGFVKNRREGMTIYYQLAPNEESIQACKFIETIFNLSELSEVIL